MFIKLAVRCVFKEISKSFLFLKLFNLNKTSKTALGKFFRTNIKLLNCLCLASLLPLTFVSKKKKNISIAHSPKSAFSSKDKKEKK